MTSCLREWLAAKKKVLAPNACARYEDCVERDLIPAFGRCRLLDLRPRQIDDWVTVQQKTSRGASPSTGSWPPRATR
ncbi:MULTISPECIES: hypothetical protein [unclassified Kitasatospora]|uniref:hypothetical protein n=1 Tax=unclassified Kitasatospora TaxID=2633591 RepID=UPI00382C78B6